MTPLLGFTPDAPRTLPGITADCSNWIPYESGMEAAPGLYQPGLDALAAPGIAAYSWTKLDNTTRVFAATNATKVYELSGVNWTDRSAGGGTYTATQTAMFAPFGDTIVMALGTATTLQSSTTGAFAAISGAPSAKIIFAVKSGGGGFLVAANTNTAQDQWQCSAANNATDWVDAIATQANSGRTLGDDAGEITAGIGFGGAALLFKRRDLFIGRYVGGATTFDFDSVIGGAGCVGPYALCTVDTGVFFVGPDQFWIYDGARPVPIADTQIRQWFFDNVSTGSRANIKCEFDRENNRVFVFFPNTSSTDGLCNEALVYHLVTKQWGRLTGLSSVGAVFTYIQAGVTWSTVTGTWAAQTQTWDWEGWNPSVRSMGLVASGTVVTLTGPPGASSFTTWDFGDDTQRSELLQANLRYQTVPTSAVCTGYVLDEAGDTAAQIGSVSNNDVPGAALNKFDLRQTGRFHRLRFDFTGPCRVIGVTPFYGPAGMR